MIIPIGTDAPIYYYPFATVGLIALNSLVYFGTLPLQPEDVEPFMLALGSGLHPIQWLTHNFLHGDIFHLGGNMVFLWAFGLIVEGKLGWLRFLGIYSLIGILHGASVQLVCLGTEPGYAIGASAVVYGLPAAAMIWAPSNDLNCFYFFIIFLRIFTGVKEIPIFAFALFYIATEIFFLVLGGMEAGSELGHSSGALWGTIVAVVMLKAGWVDCEGWDAFTRMKRWFGRGKERAKHTPRFVHDDPPGAKKVKRPRDEGAAELSIEAKGSDAVRRIQSMIDQGMAAAAFEVYRKSKERLPGWSLPERDHVALIKALHEAGAWSESIPVMRDYIQAFPQHATRVRLRAAQVLIRKLERPVRALQVLGEIPRGSLEGDLETFRAQLEAEAQQMREDGVLELEGDD